MEGEVLLEMDYDYRGRRVHRIAYEWDTSVGEFVLAGATRYLYDGWNVIKEREWARDEVAGDPIDVNYKTDLRVYAGAEIYLHVAVYGTSGIVIE